MLGRGNSMARVQADSSRAEIVTDTPIPTDKERMQSNLGMVTSMGQQADKAHGQL